MKLTSFNNNHTKDCAHQLQPIKFGNSSSNYCNYKINALKKKLLWNVFYVNITSFSWFSAGAPSRPLGGASAKGEVSACTSAKVVLSPEQNNYYNT